jgi:membrane fusion protein (multidrug efflux system)
MAGSKALKIWIFFILLFAIVFGLGIAKFFQFKKEMAGFAKMAPPPATISTIQVSHLAYQPTDSAVGTLEAIDGVNVTTQVSGEVMQKFASSGQIVDKDQSLILLDNRTAQATLANDRAVFENSQMIMQRDERLLKVHAIGQATYDNDLMAYKQAQASMMAAAVALDQHTIKAPFAGKLGIIVVNIGQYVMPGDPLVTLQTQDPIHLNFNLPESDLVDLVVGGRVDAMVDRFPTKTFVGSINAISSTIDPSTHTIAVQATFANKDHLLFPGGFATAKVYLGKSAHVLAIPNTAVTYRLYGNSVYLVTSADHDGKKTYTATLKYVTLGNPIDADHVTILDGVKEGDIIVSAGQNKLQEKNIVLINNDIPTTTANPLKQFV